MRRRQIISRLSLFFAIFVWATVSYAAPPKYFEARVENLRTSFGVPGVAVAIVEGNQTTLAAGFGVTDLSDPLPVDADTNFATGSTAKAFTAAALAILVDRGDIDWDDPVIDHMPYFRMFDAWVTREMTVRDLLVHRSGLGLGAGDLLFVPRSDLSREELVRRLQHIQPAASFRSVYAYDNVLYIAAGQLIEEVSGLTWEQFMLKNILEPAGMSRVTVTNESRKTIGNIARPHARLNGAIRGLGNQQPLGAEAILSTNAAPAGGLTVSANDMARWLKLQLAHGALPDGRQLFSEEQSREMWDPVVLMPIAPRPETLRPTQPLFNTYSLGWNVRDYQGERVVMHAGGVYGGIAMVVLIPERETGFFITMNSEDAALLHGLTFELLDHFLGLPNNDWPSKFRMFTEGHFSTALAAVQAPTVQPANVGPSLPLSGYAGSYRDPWFGTITIKQVGEELIVHYPHWPGLSATLEHYQFDTFRTRYSDPSVEPAYVTFVLDHTGAATKITMEAVSPIADFSYDYQDLMFARLKSGVSE